MRVVKEAEERKNEILDAAEKLFGTKGFDGTSTGEILDAVGIARGTLYYHFKSKEEILDAMISRMTFRLVEKAEAIVAQKNVPVLQRFVMMMLSLNVGGDSFGQELLKQIHKPQNALMHQKMEKSLLSGIVPVIAGLINEGIEQGICQTDYPEEVAEMTFLYANTVFDDLMEHSEEERQKKIEAFIYNLERLLNQERDSMKSVIMPLFQE
ncbi:MAG: TetR/AcrR family transcriptional regulator [Lachnospiraceae bacterium]|nr:TetR/AcrR family transcriptional regulator [Lachnospiraceae bacterium]